MNKITKVILSYYSFFRTYKNEDKSLAKVSTTAILGIPIMFLLFIPIVAYCSLNDITLPKVRDMGRGTFYIAVIIVSAVILIPLYLIISKIIDKNIHQIPVISKRKRNILLFIFALTIFTLFLLMMPFRQLD